MSTSGLVVWLVILTVAAVATIVQGVRLRREARDTAEHLRLWEAQLDAEDQP